MDSRKRWLVPCIAALLLIASASPAAAAKRVYPTDSAARTLNAGPAGYTSSTSSEGLCVPVLLCPAITNSHQASGGVDNTGYIRSEIGSLLGVGATSIATFNSPTFTYRGVGGRPAEQLALKIARRSDVAALLQVTGNSATYSVDLVAADGANSVSAITGEALAGLTDFGERSASIDPTSLKLGAKYQIRITSRFESGAQVLPGGSADYDNIRVQANAKNRRGGGHGGGNGSNGGNGGNGSNGGNGHNGGNGSNGGNGNGGANGKGGRYRGNGVLARTAKLRGDRLIVRVRCKRHPKSRCRLALQGRLHRHGPVVTNRRTVRVPAGHKRRAALNVRNRYLPKLRSRKHVIVREIVRKSGHKTTRFVKVRVRLG